VTANILVAFHTSAGQAGRIADRIADVLRAAGDTVEFAPIEGAAPPGAYDAIVVGDSIHSAHHSRHLIRDLQEHVAVLNALPAALFQVSLTSANPDEEHSTTAHAMVQETLDRTGFDPDIVGLFAGALVYTQYGWLKRRVMRAIVRREGGDTDMSRDYEYTDWRAVESFARDVHSLAHRSVTDTVQH
jgi:menaquinone-dependent protoporphyrinogen oxidase